MCWMGWWVGAGFFFRSPEPTMMGGGGGISSRRPLQTTPSEVLGADLDHGFQEKSETSEKTAV